ncbi:MAG: type VI secretion system-associated FHA domain protein [Thiohalomonadales bacterium]
MLPAVRKAKYWELFKTQYHKVAQDAENDFLHLLGNEFSAAYSHQIDKLKRSRQ